MYQVPRYADESGVGGYAACLPCQLAPSAHTVAARVGRVGKRGGSLHHWVVCQVVCPCRAASLVRPCALSCERGKYSSPNQWEGLMGKGTQEWYNSKSL